MKLIEVMFKLDEPLPEWQQELVWQKNRLHVQVSDDIPNRVWMLFSVDDDYEVPE